jgi:hypothetical protein
MKKLKKTVRTTAPFVSTIFGFCGHFRLERFAFKVRMHVCMMMMMIASVILVFLHCDDCSVAGFERDS